MFPDYAQILSYPQPPLEVLAKARHSRRAAPHRQRRLRRAVRQANRDHFPGFVAQVSLAAPDAGAREAERAIKELGALGVQIYTNVAGKPIDRPEFAPFWAKMNELGKPIWMHPARGAETPGLSADREANRCTKSGGLSAGPTRPAAPWRGWSFRRHSTNTSEPQDHRAPFRRHRADAGGPPRATGWDQLGTRTTDEDYVALRKSLKKRPLDYFKHDFYADTAAFGGVPATKCGLEFYPAGQDHVRVRLPVRSGRRARCTSARPWRSSTSLNLPKAQREAMDHRTSRRSRGVKLVK